MGKTIPPTLGGWDAKKNPGGTSVGTEAADRWQRLRQAVRPTNRLKVTNLFVLGGVIPLTGRVSASGPRTQANPRPLLISGSVPERQRLRASPWMPCFLCQVRVSSSLCTLHIPRTELSHVFLIVPMWSSLYPIVERNNTRMETTSRNLCMASGFRDCSLGVKPPRLAVVIFLLSAIQLHTFQLP